MESAIWGLVGTLLGALIAGGASIWNENRKRHAETEASVIAAAFQYAALEWRGHIKVALRDGGAVLPPALYLAQAIEIARLANSGHQITAADLKRIEQAAQKLTTDFCEQGLGHPRSDVGNGQKA